MADALTRWVPPLLQRWSQFVLNNNDGYPTISLMGRIKEQGLTGAFIRDTSNTLLPIREMPKDIKTLHEIVKKLPKELQDVIIIKYLTQGSDRKKARAMGLGRQQYYQWLNKAHVWIAARFES